MPADRPGEGLTEDQMKRMDAALLTILAVVFGFVLASGMADAPPSDQDKQKRTVADIRNTGTAMFSWLTDQVGAAAAGQSQVPEPIDLADYVPISHADLATLLVPTYMQEVPELDGWESPYDFYLNVANPLAEQIMSIRSPGRDGAFSDTFYTVDPFDPESFDEDIVWADGFFARWPQKR
jgi:hypothetical protein